MTTKERVLQALRDNATNGRIDRDQLAHVRLRVGLSWHDLTKNLHQLASEEGSGVASVIWKRDQPVAVELEGTPPATPVPEAIGSYSHRVREWLRTQPAGPGIDGFTQISPATIDAAVAPTPGQSAINVLTSMERRGEVVLRRVVTPGGARKRITGVRVRQLLPQPATNGTLAVPWVIENVEAPLPAMPATPMLDSYVEARMIAGRLAENPYLTGSVSFTPDKLAEEALLLRAALRKAIER